MIGAFKALMVTGAVSIASLGMVQAPASAIPFSDIINVLTDITNTIGGVDSTVRGIDNAIRSIDSLTRTLGLQESRDSVGEVDITEILEIYQQWYQKLTPAEQQIVSWLVMEYAHGREVSFDAITKSDWFLQKSTQEQQLVGSLFFKFNAIMEVVANEKARFLSYAFCVNSGSSECNP